MLRNISLFYLTAMYLVFVIAISSGLRGAAPAEMFFVALLGWPISALLLVAVYRANRIFRPGLGGE
ncbi:hypothetical protein [Oceanomicrobium pacificus]|uniref:DUF2842 domain-containing protein n=1 Tax=Oceanomicrobium pacificus TaxID=2692916 RepID=A0A6B0TSS4_9RHOB|nr:hypothetical protein [Oceanomicrobium pacificus]MXU64865.1 hypothetical protein [Oceanomicrobium pacificus]